MRGPPPLLLAALAVLLPGCLGPEGDDLSCPETNTWGRIDSYDPETGDMAVVLMDFSPATLHTQDADIHQQVGDECYEAFASGLEPGKEISFDADEWAESYPPQAWPGHLVLLG